MKISIVYEDDYILAVNKPAGCICHPVGSQQGDNIIARVHYYYGKNVRILHRLDKNTSGVLLLAKDEKIIPKMYKQFFRRHIQKTYLAIVHGKIIQSTGKIELPIAKVKKGILQLKMEINQQDGLVAETSYEVISSQNNYTLVSVKPTTGRKHQIRLHLSTIGHPIVGDYIYNHAGVPFLWEYYLGYASPWHQKIPGHALHAHSIIFTHPVFETEICATAPFPEYFNNFCKPNEILI